MRKQGLIIFVLVTTIVVLFGARAVVSNRLTTSGVELGKAQEELKKVQTENVAMKEKIYALSSLTHISSQAAELGFVESKSNFAVLPAQPIALGR